MACGRHGGRGITVAPILTSTIPIHTSVVAGDIDVGRVPELIAAVQDLGIKTTGKETVGTKEPSLDTKSGPGIVIATVAVVGNLAFLMRLSAMWMFVSMLIVTTMKRAVSFT